MLAAGMLLDRALSNYSLGFAGDASSQAGEEDSAVGPRMEVVRPHQMYAEDDLRLQVARAFVESGNGLKPRLQVVLEVSNAGKVVKIDFDRMQDIELPLTRMIFLSDDFDNRYQTVGCPELILDEDYTAPTSLYPGDHLQVRLVFDAPSPRRGS